LTAAVGALPCDSVTGHAPGVFIQAGLADTETAAALPAKRQLFAATVADMQTGFSPFPGRLSSRFIRRFWHTPP